MKKLNLIDGNFNLEEAKEIILKLISNEIKFHALKEFSLQERTGESEAGSLQKISELKKEKENFMTIFEQAKKDNLRLEIQTSLNIAFVPKEETEEV